MRATNIQHAQHPQHTHANNKLEIRKIQHTTTCDMWCMCSCTPLQAYITLGEATLKHSPTLTYRRTQTHAPIVGARRLAGPSVVGLVFELALIV